MTLLASPARASVSTVEVEATVDRSGQLSSTALAAAHAQFEEGLRARGFPKPKKAPAWFVRLTLTRSSEDALDAEVLVLSNRRAMKASLRASAKGASANELVTPLVNRLVSDVARELDDKSRGSSH